MEKITKFYKQKHNWRTLHLAVPTEITKEDMIKITKFVSHSNYATMIRISVVGFLVNWEIKNCTVYNHDAS